jgi:RHS repeat-associated protein
LLLLLHFGLQAQTRTVHLYYTDPEGNVLAETDVHGNIIARYDYRPYGSVVQGPGPNGPGYAGHVNDPETGLSYMQQRYYDPGTGRFLSPDPVPPSSGDLSAFNRYDYVGNNPITRIDPDGRQFEPVPPEAAAAEEEGAAAAAAEGGGIRIILIDPANPVSMTLRPPNPTVQQNKAAGDAFENKVADSLKGSEKTVAQQITVKTASGVKTRIDIVTKSSDGSVSCVECKSSSTAKLTKNQRAAFPEIEKSGATVVGKGKPGVPGGTAIPPQRVQVVRPPPPPPNPSNH